MGFSGRHTPGPGRDEAVDRFANRAQAGDMLGEALAARLGESPADVVVIALPRGGVPVAGRVAARLHAPLDVVVVRKLGLPSQPEVAVGAVGEGGVIVVNPWLARRVPGDRLDALARREEAEVAARVARWRGGPGLLGEVPDGVGRLGELRGRTVILVDDGIATGATVRAAVTVLREHGADRMVLAVPVAARDSLELLAADVDDIVCLLAPDDFGAVGRWYEDFGQVPDDDVRRLLDDAARDVRTHDPGPTDPGPTDPGPTDPGPTDPGPTDPGPRGTGTFATGAQDAGSPVDGPRGAGPFATGAQQVGPPAAGPRSAGPPAAARTPTSVEIPSDVGPLVGSLTVPDGATGLAIFAHGSGSGRHSPRNVAVARQLNAAGLATLLLDLLTPEEAGARAAVFDIGLLASRLGAATAWVGAEPAVAGYPLGYFGASTGAAAALWAAADRPDHLRAVVSRGGRPDLAAERLPLVHVPTLLVVGERDTEVLVLNRAAQQRLTCPTELDVVPGATHLFEEPGTLETAGALAVRWFLTHLHA
ncbi:MAG: phosphoribosyltransferase family protein [Georgenia sp.]